MNPGGTLASQRYRVLHKLAQGGMGAVYLADDTRLPGRKVAVKENLDASPEAQAQFKREALLLARLEHPNLPRVTDAFSERGCQYLVMDYVPGDDLVELTRQQGQLPEADLLACMRQVMAALHYMHTWRDPETNQPHPVIHRDIKPANIKRTPAGRYVLVDFGLAKSGDAGMTGASAKAYTPGYAPLEQYHGGTDQRSDVYSLGATLYALATGTVPPSATSMANGAPLPPVRTYNPSVSQRFITVIEHAMRLRADERYPSIDAMHQALFGSGLAPKAPPVKRRPAMAWVLAGAGVGLLVVVLLWLVLSGSPAQQAAPATAATVQPATATPDAAGSAAPPAQAGEPATPEPTIAAPARAAVTATDPTAVVTDTVAAASAARATSTPLGTPGAPTPTPSGTRPTSTPIPSPTRLPSPTPRPTVAAPTAAPTVAMVVTDAATAPVAAAGPASVRILFPPDGHSSDVPLVFSWTTDAPLAGGQEFEVVFWNPNSESIGQSRGWAHSTTESSLRIDPSGQAPGNYQWGVYLIVAEPYARLRYLGGGRNFAVAGSSVEKQQAEGASSGGGKPRP